MGLSCVNHLWMDNERMYVEDLKMNRYVYLSIGRKGSFFFFCDEHSYFVLYSKSMYWVNTGSFRCLRANNDFRRFFSLTDVHIDLSMTYNEKLKHANPNILYIKLI